MSVDTSLLFGGRAQFEPTSRPNFEAHVLANSESAELNSDRSTSRLNFWHKRHFTTHNSATLLGGFAVLVPCISSGIKVVLSLSTCYVDQYFMKTTPSVNVTVNNNITLLPSASLCPE